jgi:hypothetical protein
MFFKYSASQAANELIGQAGVPVFVCAWDTRGVLGVAHSCVCGVCVWCVILLLFCGQASGPAGMGECV